MGKKFSSEYQPKNRGKRPSIPKEVRDHAREYTLDIVDTYAEIMQNKEASDQNRIGAARELKYMAWGKDTPLNEDGDATVDWQSFVSAITGQE